MKYKDQIKGGRADKKTPSDFDSAYVEKGRLVEMEHTTDPMLATEIALDHLEEFPDYYEELEVMEKKLKKENPPKPKKKTNNKRFSIHMDRYKEVIEATSVSSAINRFVGRILKRDKKIHINGEVYYPEKIAVAIFKAKRYAYTHIKELDDNQTTKGNPKPKLETEMYVNLYSVNMSKRLDFEDKGFIAKNCELIANFDMNKGYFGLFVLNSNGHDLMNKYFDASDEIQIGTFYTAIKQYFTPMEVARFKKEVQNLINFTIDSRR